MEKQAVLESLLYVAGDEGLKKEELCRILEVDMSQLDQIIDALIRDYKDSKRGLMLEVYGGRLKIITKKENATYLKKLFSEETNENLSPSALETLAIIAYNEPITRTMVDEIRGVSSAHLIRKLVFKNLVKDVGRSELPGRPILYGVTDEFLDHFGIASLAELPKIKEEEQEEIPVDLFDSKYKEV